MSRRSTPARLSDARRAATVNRLTGEGELPTRAEAKVAAWEARTASDERPRDGAYWGRGGALDRRSSRAKVSRRVRGGSPSAPSPDTSNRQRDPHSSKKGRTNHYRRGNDADTSGPEGTLSTRTG